MSVGFAKPRNPEHIPEHSLWVLRKDSRTAEARVADGRNVGDVAEAAKAEWLARGWSAE